MPRTVIDVTELNEGDVFELPDHAHAKIRAIGVPLTFRNVERLSPDDEYFTITYEFDDETESARLHDSSPEVVMYEN